MLTQELASRAADIRSAGLVDLDVTVVAALVIFIGLMVVLNGMLFKPYLEILEKRGLKIEGAREEAKKISARAGESVGVYDAKLAEARAEAVQQRDALRREGQDAEEVALTAARTEANEKIRAGQALVQAQLDTASAELDTRAAELSKAIAARVLSQAS